MKKRSQSYQQEKARNQVLREARSLEDFIAELDLRVTIEQFRPEMLTRVSQLTQRTNQFNTTTIRRGESELKTQLDSAPCNASPSQPRTALATTAMWERCCTRSLRQRSTWIRFC